MFMRSCALVAALAGAAVIAHAQPIQWNASSGLWGSAANWNPMNVPNTPGEHAVLGGLLPYVVDLDVSPVIGSLQVENPAAALRIGSGQTLTLNAGSVNHGVVSFNPQNLAALATLSLSGGVIDLGGSGEFRLLSGSASSIAAAPGASLVNGASHTIRGVGSITAPVDNRGHLFADASIALSGTDLRLLETAVANSGAMAAQAGSTLTLSGSSVTQSAGGEIRCDGGEVRFTGGSLSGGRVAGLSSWLVTPGPSVMNRVAFNGVTLDAPGSLGGFTELNVGTSGLVNNSTMQIQPLQNQFDASLYYGVSGGLGGSGEVLMMGPKSYVFTPIDAVITQGPLHTIRGVGKFIANIDNNGQIIADTSVRAPGQNSNTLEMHTRRINNNALMAAAPASVMFLGNFEVDQTGGGQLLCDGGTIEFGSNTTLRGGSIQATGAGYWTGGFSSTFESVVNHAPGQILLGTLSLEGSGLENHRTIEMNPAGSTNNATLNAAANTSLTGPGEVLMRAGSDNCQITSSPGAVLTHGPDHIIRGAGRIGAQMVNNGTIVADPSVVVAHGTNLLFQTSPKANNGVIRAEAGASISINGITIDQSGGGRIELNGGSLAFTNGWLIGGRIDAAGLGSWTINSISTVFDGVVNNAPGSMLSGTDPAVCRVVSGLVNNARIALNPLVAPRAGAIRFDESGALSGAGRIEMFGGPDRAEITASVDVTLTHAAGHSIYGAGDVSAAVGAAFVNEGLVSPGAYPTGQDAISVSGSFVHRGTLRIEVAGTDPAQHDRLTGPATHTLGGTLDVRLAPGYTPARQHSMRIITANANAGRFETVLKPALAPGMALRVVYLPDAVDLVFHCPPDLTTGAVAGQSGYGIPNGVLDNDDFFFYLSLFAAGDQDADLTATAIQGQPGYGAPNGVVNNDDFFYYLSIFAAGC